MRFLLFILLFLLLFACGKPKPEFKALNDGIQLKLIAFGESEKERKNEKYVRAAIQLNSTNDVLYQQDEFAVLQIENSPFNELFEELNEGDSAYFKVPLAYLKAVKFNIYTENAADTLIGYIKIHQYLNDEEKENYFSQNDPELLEQLSLKKYLSNIKEIENKNGVSIITIKKGEGEKVEHDKNVILKYRASFINGVEFDNTYFYQNFEYKFGTPNQLIKGLEIALYEMKNKEKAKIIIPSQLAFGDEGSSTGIVPPFTTVVYDLEIIDIK